MVLGDSWFSHCGALDTAQSHAGSWTFSSSLNQSPAWYLFDKRRKRISDWEKIMCTQHQEQSRVEVFPTYGPFLLHNIVVIHTAHIQYSWADDKIVEVERNFSLNSLSHIPLIRHLLVLLEFALLFMFKLSSLHLTRGCLHIFENVIKYLKQHRRGALSTEWGAVWCGWYVECCAPLSSSFQLYGKRTCARAKLKGKWRVFQIWENERHSSSSSNNNNVIIAH